MAIEVPYGILLKTTRPLARMNLGVAGGKLRPILQSVTAQSQKGIAAPARWAQLSFDEDRRLSDLWDKCHELAGGGRGSDSGVQFAEPDLPQTWRFEPPAEIALAAATPCGVTRPPADDTPSRADPLWFRDEEHSQFGLPGQASAQGAGARIAHLDTGFDPRHNTFPDRVRKDLQRNFIEGGQRDDATDKASGAGTQHGHGTATLALLASREFGGAPDAEVAPFRVANSVVLFSNSTVAQALDEAHRLTVANEAPIDVITMSMGGVASQAWAEAVNALYDAGVFVVTAAGNNYGNLPTRFIVYPARFNRVVAACGVMSDFKAYADLPLRTMAGNYGPKRKMATALAAATPNVPWARIGCPTTVDHCGSGTSSATPQIAAAAARWIATHRAALEAYPEAWMRVEAARLALFTSAAAGDASRLGHGRLRANDALALAPAEAARLRRTKEDSVSFPALRILTGLGLAAAPNAAQRLLELEALQLSQRAGLDELVDDPERPMDAMSSEERRRLAEALADQPEASLTLRTAVGSPVRRVYASSSLPPSKAADAMARYHLETALAPKPPQPAQRRLRAYAYDPVMSGRLDGWGLNEAALCVQWEALEPGPIGEYVEVIDVDPASDCAYAPIDLDHPHLVATDGLAPNEADPQFHQQMVYAVSMKTVGHFENALGRVALWAPRFKSKRRDIEAADFVRRLRIYPHALREENAYYSPERSALLFGYFNARDADTGEVLPGGTVFSCLSHDIVAHETTHALLDGLHVHFREGGPDALAFHEAFSDLVALFQHFTVPEALKAEIAKTRGDLRDENLLAQLAVQFGQSTGRYGALRDAIGRVVDGVWRRWEPTPHDYDNAVEAHDRGAVLVAAVFDAFLDVYRARSADLIRLATAGTGILPAGAIPVDLVNRLAAEAGAVAGEILQMCIRALDYCAPVDITFSDYLRALVTADLDVSGESRREHRLAIVAAFRARGIFPKGVRQLSVQTLAWEAPPIPLPKLEELIAHLEEELKSRWSLHTAREDVWRSSRQAAVALWRDLKKHVPTQELAALGLERAGRVARTIEGVDGRLDDFTVHSVRPARRIDETGQARTDLVIEVTQAFTPTATPGQVIRGGCTILFDLELGRVRYLVRKRLGGRDFLRDQMGFRMARSGDSLRDAYFETFEGHSEPFAALHRHL